MTEQNDWQNALSSSYEQLIAYLIAYVPQLLGALFLIFLGWLIAWLSSRLVLSLMRFVSRIWQQTSFKLFPGKSAELSAKHALIVSKTVFWIVMLFFIAAATASLGLDFFATWLSSFLSYVPQLLAGLLIIIGGYLLGNVASIMAETTAQTAGFKRPGVLGRLAKMAVLFTALVIGIEQLGINIQFITTLMIVVTGVLLSGIALAFALSSKLLLSNILAARQARKHLRVNEHICIAQVEGILVEISATMLVIETAKGRCLVPAKFCLESTSEISVVVDPANSK